MGDMSFSSSQSNFIASRIVKKLGVRLSAALMPVQGISGVHIVTHHKAQIIVTKLNMYCSVRDHRGNCKKHGSRRLLHSTQGSSAC